MKSLFQKSFLVLLTLTLNAACAIQLKPVSEETATDTGTPANNIESFDDVGPNRANLSAGVNFNNGDHICSISKIGSTDIISKKVLSIDENASATIEYNGYYYQANHTGPEGINMTILEKNSERPVDSRMVVSAQKDENGILLIYEKNLTHCFSPDYCLAYEKPASANEFQPLTHDPVVVAVGKNGIAIDLAPEYTKTQKILLSVYKYSSQENLLMVLKPDNNQRFQLRAAAKFNADSVVASYNQIKFSCVKMK